jgi:hypothetical protein
VNDRRRLHAAVELTMLLFDETEADGPASG